MTLYILGLIASVLIGLSLGYLGGGGSIITVPVLIYLLQIPVHEAIGMSLVVVGSTSAIGVYLHHKKGSHLDLRSGILFGSIGLVGAYLGSLTSTLISGRLLILMFAGLMTAVAIAMLLRKQVDTPRLSVPHWKTLVAGAFVGFLTGFLGVGGGFLIVPALVLLTGMNTKRAVPTSLLVISMNCVAGFLGHLHSTSFNLFQTVIVASLAIIGLLAGTRFARGASSVQLQRFFAIFVFVTGIALLALNL